MKKKDVAIMLAKVAIFIATIFFWIKLLGGIELSLTGNVAFVVACLLLMIPVTLIGRKVLDSHIEKVTEITGIVQAFRFFLVGSAIIKAIKTSEAWVFGFIVPMPYSIGLVILIIAGLALVFTMLNLFIGGLGAPTVAASVKLATGWLYKKTRNPMVLAMFTWLIAWGIFLQSSTFILWVLTVVVPIETFFEKHYEERELEIRFGESYIKYRNETPFMFPRLKLSTEKTAVVPATTGRTI